MNLVAGMVIAFVLTFVFRFTSAGFGNDHFTHLSRARQILGGAWPIRDFFDPGQFLHYYLSAAAQLVFGYNLYGEALLTISFMSLGAALTFGVSARLSRSQAEPASAHSLAPWLPPKIKTVNGPPRGLRLTWKNSSRTGMPVIRVACGLKNYAVSENARNARWT